MNQYCGSEAINRREKWRNVTLGLILIVLVFQAHSVLELRKGKRFTFDDGVLMSRMCGARRLTDQEITEHYGDKKTDFRLYLEGEKK